jgi:hypothetical protein
VFTSYKTIKTRLSSIKTVTDAVGIAVHFPQCFQDILAFILVLSEYKDVRYDKDIRKSYLQGRLGGIPRIL